MGTMVRNIFRKHLITHDNTLTLKVHVLHIWGNRVAAAVLVRNGARSPVETVLT